MKIRYKPNNLKKNGGKIIGSPILEKILSIGFEFETGNMTPVSYDEEFDKFTVTKIEPDKLPIVKITNDIDVHITSDADTPSITGGVQSSISEMETKYLNPNNQKFRDFINEYIFVNDENGEYVFYNHTEYMFTFLKNNDKFNDNNIIVKYFSFVIDYLMKCFEFQTDISNSIVDTKLKIFSNNSLLYLIPMKYNENLTPIDIKWVPQMTINVKVIDIIPVLEYLSSDLNADSRNGIINCKFFAYKIIPEQGEILRATRTNRMIDQVEFTEIQKHILNIIRNCLFMLLYLFLYGSGIEGTILQKIEKNHFDFLFRSSISRIIISLCIKYSKIDIITCLQYINNKLLKEQIDISETIERAKKQREKINLLDYYKYNACISFNNFITIFVNQFDNYKTLLSSENQIDDIFDKIDNSIMKYNIRPLTEEEKRIIDEDPKKIIPNYYLSTNTFFTKIFKNSSNYYPYDVENESILVEFRSFGQNLLIEANDTTKNVYKNLKEWENIIKTLRTPPKSLRKSTKSLRKSTKSLRKSTKSLRKSTKSLRKTLKKTTRKIS